MNKINALTLAVMSIAIGSTIMTARAEPYPLEYFALRDVISNVRVSPDGNYLGLMKIPAKDAEPIIEIYDAGDLSKEPFRVNADPMEITAFYWVSDTNFVMELRQQVRDKIEGYNQGVYEYRIAAVDVKKEEIKSFDELGATVWHLLPNEPNKIILSFFPDLGETSKVEEQFRPRSYYEFDLNRGTKKLLLQGKLSMGQIEFDGDGNPWLARGFDRGKGDYVWYVRRRGSKGWEEVYRLNEFRFDNFEVYGIDNTKADSLFVGAQNGNDKKGLWAFNINTKSLDELIYQRSDVDVAGVRMHSNPWTNPDTVVGVAYRKDKIHIYYFDEVEEATFEQLGQLIPYSYYLRITSRSRDGETLTIHNVGPKDPGSYYMIKDKRLQLIGSEQPLIRNEDLADVRYINYESRDGRKIPGFLTVPKGDGPFPAVILPHGGPYVAEVVIYDELSQMLANNGYLVLQPQYRGSQGYGLDHWTAAFKGASQAGRKMQDDKDDGALYLVEQGLADSDRLAIAGGSYGGYAALVAASRTPQIYQCVIGIAVVSDTIMQVNFGRDTLRGAAVEAWLDLWLNAVSPIEEVEKVNVPILIVHGTVDQRTPPVNARKYVRALRKHGKNFKYVPLEDADHFFDTFKYHHWMTLYETMIDYLENDCGPDGL
jgi:dipeptidyl aminopeptidase/acylaminoacyl peptidase